MNSSRYPYTYACDYLRMLSGKQDNGISPRLSRAQASHIRKTISEVMGLDDEEVAKGLADKFLALEAER